MDRERKERENEGGREREKGGGKVVVGSWIIEVVKSSPPKASPSKRLQKVTPCVS